jgi:pantetheine-phosphate adenylyltransferase
LKTAIYPGTFDPITHGHIDVIRRARMIFDRVIVTLAKNPEKVPLFSLEERYALIRSSIQDIPDVEVADFDGLVVRFAETVGAVAIIRGLRAVSDFEYEFQMALTNRKLSANIITVFLMPHERFTYLNSNIVREVARLRGDISPFVPACVEEALKKKFPPRS